VATDSRSALPLFAMLAIVILAHLVGLAERNWRLAAWETHVYPALFIIGGLFFLLLIPVRFFAYVIGVPMQELTSPASFASIRWTFTTFGGVFLVFGIGLWVWATRAKAARASR